VLVAEDALRVLLTSWDDCVERSWRESESIQAARNDVEAENLRGQFILKIHGCCTQPETLLITSDQLSAAPLWTRIYFQARFGPLAPGVREPDCGSPSRRLRRYRTAR
jgi:hypothetical protein